MPPRNLDKRTTITIGEKVFEVEADDLESISELGRGAYGIVEKMLHRPSQTVMAVKVRKNRIAFNSSIAYLLNSLHSALPLLQ